jgi:hypothetical protein
VKWSKTVMSDNLKFVVGTAWWSYHQDRYDNRWIERKIGKTPRAEGKLVKLTDRVEKPAPDREKRQDPKPTPKRKSGSSSDSSSSSSSDSDSNSSSDDERTSRPIASAAPSKVIQMKTLAPRPPPVAAAKPVQRSIQLTLPRPRAQSKPTSTTVPLAKPVRVAVPVSRTKIVPTPIAKLPIAPSQSQPAAANRSASFKERLLEVIRKNREKSARVQKGTVSRPRI